MQTTLGSRSRRVAALGLGLTLAGFAVPLAAGAAPDRAGSCPTSTQIVDRFGRGLDVLVRAGELTRSEAAEAGERFAGWVRDEAPADLGCALRETVIEHGRDVLELIDLGPLEARAAFRDGQSLAEMAEANGIARDELVETLNGIVADGIDRLEAEGAIEASVAAALEELAAERIDTAVDFKRGDPLPAGLGHDDPLPAGFDHDPS